MKLWTKQKLLIVCVIFLIVGVGLTGLSTQTLGQGYPHLEATVEIDPASIQSSDQEISVTINIDGVGGRIEDLPLGIRESLPRKPLDVVLIIDVSGSMDETDYAPNRMKAAINAAKLFAGQLAPDDRVAIVTFSASASTELGYSSNILEINSRIENLYAQGGTAIGEGIITAMNLLGQSRDEAVKSFVLLSDGANNEGRDPIEMSRFADEQGIPIYTVGIGTTIPSDTSLKLDEQTLMTIAANTGGEYLYAPDVEALKGIYEKMSGKALNVAGLNVDWSVEVTPFFQIAQGAESGHYDSITVGSAKTAQIVGVLNIDSPGVRIPIISKITVTYSDIVSREIRELELGPFFIDFTGATEQGDIQIRSIKFQYNDESYLETIVYHLEDDVRVTVQVRNPSGAEFDYVATVFKPRTGEGSVEIDSTDSERIRHKLSHSGTLGLHNFTESIYYPYDMLSDSDSDSFYVLFDNDDDNLLFAQSDTYWGNRAVTLHPRSGRILELAADYLHEVSEKEEAAAYLAWATTNSLTYDTETRDHADDFSIIDAELGWCVDYTALYLSLARSLNLPARGITIFYYQVGKLKQQGHAFAEVQTGDGWYHVEPQDPAGFNKPDRYIRWGCSYMIGNIVDETGSLVLDTATTVKYAIGMVSPSPYDGKQNPIVIDVEKENSQKANLFFANIAKQMKEPLTWLIGVPVPNPFAGEDSDYYYGANFRIRVMYSNGLDIDVGRLSDDNTLTAGEKDYAPITVTIPEGYPVPEKEGETQYVDITIRVTYDTIDGERISKDYTLWVLLLK